MYICIYISIYTYLCVCVCVCLYYGSISFLWFLSYFEDMSVEISWRTYLRLAGVLKNILKK